MSGRIPMAALLGVCVVLVGCARGGRENPLTTPAVVASEPEGVNNLFQVENIWFGGQPSPEALRDFAQRGLRTIINLRTEAEMAQRVEFDEPALARELDLGYVHLPLTPDTFDAAFVRQFSLEMAAAEDQGGVLVHCASSNRVGGLWAAYLHHRFNMSPEEALERGRSAGLRSESMVEAARRAMQEAGGGE